MSLYNALFGINSAAPMLLKMLGIDAVKMPDPPKELMSSYTTKEGQTETYFDYGERVYENEIPEAVEAWDKFREELLQLKYFPSGRFRDAYLNETGKKIILYTRNGGGNRPYYQYVFDLLRKHPLYLSDYDDDYDCTYAYIVFKVPDEYIGLCEGLATGEKPETIDTKFHKLIEALKS